MDNPELILYPTESVYGLGVNPFAKEALLRLYELKGRSESKPVSWLVRDFADIERYAEVNNTARTLAEQFLPGPLTLVLKLRPEYSSYGATDGTIGFRVSTDKVAQALIKEWYVKYDAPITATSANLSGENSLATVEDILAQFCDRKSSITRVIDDGPRTGTPSTVVRVNSDGTLEVLRESAIKYTLIREKCGL